MTPVQPTAPKTAYVSTINSTSDLLGAAGVYSGEWENNTLNHVLVNGISDQSGSVTIQFGIGIDKDNVSQTDSLTINVTDGLPFYKSFVKGVSRWCRVVYTNGSTPQTSFSLQTMYGNNYLANQEGRQDVVQHSHPDNVNAHLDLSATGGTAYDIILIDLSDTVNFKHINKNYIHLENLSISIDAEINASYSIIFGWLENVDGSSGDFHEIHHLNGTKKVGQNKFQQIYTYPNGAKLTSSNTITSDISQNDTAFQTDVNLPSLLDPATSNTPSGDGDFVIRITSTGGGSTDFDIDVMFSYHTH